ncbi:TadE/TadG family type IV pilus assembly protein [Marinobacter sp. P4B1]|uniref:TadE/TadG family type IV pilus assembly protein n=1 Tax=Marinobacter sp. P4B1 TaxID=1119533 RepID=UPI00130DEA3E|nr:TadE family protein [Marinobacter sp. P4B1]
MEFLLVFPLLIALLYAGLVYGILFFHKVQMQRAVDMASSAVYSLDRRNFSTYSDKVVTHSKDVLDRMVASLPERIRTKLTTQTCAPDGGNADMVMLKCTLVAGSVDPESCGSDEADTGSPFLPQLSIGPLGDFPPQPKCLKAVAAVTF